MTQRSYNIYKISNTVNKKVYIGQTVNPLSNRFYTHIHCSTSEIGKAIKALGADKFKIELLDDSATSNNESLLLEHHYITLYNSIDEGYNMRPASISCAKLHKIHKPAISACISRETVERLKLLSKETRIPQAQYIQEAIEDLLKKYEKPVK